jgi:hypothetical protein
MEGKPLSQKNFFARAILFILILVTILMKPQPSSLNAVVPSFFPSKMYLTATPGQSLTLPLTPEEVPNRTPDTLVVFDTTDMDAMNKAMAEVEEAGGALVHVYPPHISIGYVPQGADTSLLEQAGIEAIHRSIIDPNEVVGYGFAAEMAVRAWNANFQGDAPSEPLSPDDHPVPLPLSQDMLVMPVPTSVSQASPAAAPGNYQTSEFMIGKIAVGIILPESSSGSESWGIQDPDNPGSDRRQLVTNEIQAGLNWWAVNEARANLTFVYDIHTNVPTSYEPIEQTQSNEGLWINQVMTELGYSSPGEHGEKVRSYINNLRVQSSADWAFAIFVVDSLNDSDGIFADEMYFAYSYLGGPFLVMTYDNDGWGIGQMDNVTSHEVGHTFLALDEYTGASVSCTERSGYLNIETQNSAYPNEGACLLNESCIMRGSGPACTYTRQQIGWRDSDGDNILDPVDTTPVLALEPWPPEIIYEAQLTYNGTAEDIAYNSSTRQDVTINRITSVEYEIDYDGMWRPAGAVDGVYDESSENYSFTTPPLLDGGHSIYIRAANQVGNVSELLYDTFTIETTPTKTSTPTVTTTSTSTPTRTATSTSTRTATPTPTRTMTPTATRTPTPTATRTPTPTSTRTMTPTTTHTSTPTLVPDTESPTVNWVKPVSDSESYTALPNEAVLLEAIASDNVKVESVHFDWWDAIKGTWVVLGVDTTSPYQTLLNSATFNNEWNQVNATSFDTAGNVSASPYIWIYKSPLNHSVYMPLISR